MTKRAALRLASYLRSLGHQVRVRQLKSRMGASFYSLEFLARIIHGGVDFLEVSGD
jgi:hypothetical protein